jgi:sRNA-binding regulator protein Hfq
VSQYLRRSAHPPARPPRPPASSAPPLPPPAKEPARTAKDADGEPRHWESRLWEEFRQGRVPLEVVCFDGIVLTGYLLAWEKYTILLQTPEGKSLIMKHGIIRVTPRGVSRSPAREEEPKAAGSEAP